MWEPFLISENKSLCLSIHTRPDAFGSHRRGSPPSTGTTHVSQPFMCDTVYAMRDMSGENTGLILLKPSRVSCCGSPSGRILTQIWPDATNVLGPRMKVSIHPPAQTAG